MAERIVQIFGGQHWSLALVLHPRRGHPPDDLNVVSLSQHKRLMAAEDLSQIDLIAMRYIGLSAEEVHTTREAVPIINATYYRSTAPGGRAILVGDDGTVLCMDSKVPFHTHVNAYKQGCREQSRYL